MTKLELFLATGVTKSDVEDYYKYHTSEECLSFFNISAFTFKNLFKHFNIKQRSPRQTQMMLFYREHNLISFDDAVLSINKDEFVEYYSLHTREEISNKFRITPDTYTKLLKLWNIKYKSQQQNTEIEKRRFSDKYGEGATCTFNVNELNNKCKKSKLKKYGNEEYVMTDSFRKQSKLKYFYNNMWFDSSWELALWIYAIDHNQQIIREPTRFAYIYNEKEHYYYPDFYYDGKLIEIKGNQFISEDGSSFKAIYESKNEQARKKYDCMIDNNVDLWLYDNVKFALEYCTCKFNKKTWYVQFRKKK